MPIVRVEMFEGRDNETKRELVQALTREMVRVTGCKEASVSIVITDISKDNWGVGGEIARLKYPD
ncbi:tautomerase family protein [Sneathiella chinensis]|uniref:Tautomerase n=1 Tax=Sneathiella chinensis TaxID=349750 RepID=A0ABQ5U4D3_9PROT|nr:2-hydroxymuconate tautomerase family protein [Sneathiella chinensis]GLQ05336.1 hypothetical protein GCM10007924_05570 [Sneathiella chinensis]